LAADTDRIEEAKDGSARSIEQFLRTMLIKEIGHDEEASTGSGVAVGQFTGAFRTGSGGR
jgi:hypothetical protein